MAPSVAAANANGRCVLVCVYLRLCIGVGCACLHGCVYFCGVYFLHSSIGVREELGEYKVMALLIEHIELYNVFASHSTKSWRCSLVRLPSVQRHLH